MKHYICTGECGGESEVPKACGMESCNMYGKELTECNCTDGKHNKKEEEE